MTHVEDRRSKADPQKGGLRPCPTTTTLPPASALIRSRDALVGARTKLVNHVRGAVKSFGARLPKCTAESFHNRVAEHLPQELAPHLAEARTPRSGR